MVTDGYDEEGRKKEEACKRKVGPLYSRGWWQEGVGDVEGVEDVDHVGSFDSH